MYVDVVSAAVEEKSAQLFYSIGPAGGFHIGLLALSGVVYAGFIGIDELSLQSDKGRATGGNPPALPITEIVGIAIR